MLDPNEISVYQLSLSAHEKNRMQERLELFQTFVQLYECHRELLDELLTLPDTSNAVQQRQVEAFYVQGIVTHHQVYLLSNLADHQSRCFGSPICQWTLGRDPRQSMIAVKDKRLSRCHALIQYAPDQGFLLTDLESTNGTYVNGRKIDRSCALQDGDQIRLGSLGFSFYTCHQITVSTSSPVQLPTAVSAAEGTSTLLDTLRIRRPDF
jgi:pSer/pThr/pTyr-binding forkhead associated (FHA) protein